MRIPDRFQAPCYFCQETIDVRKPAGNYRFGSGWFKLRTEGGANAVHLPEMEQVYACKWCVDKKSKGAAQYQMNLFG